MKNNIIYLARLTVETASPLAIGSGRQGLATDRLVARDAYTLPYLPGTSLAGCLRSALGEDLVKAIFGSQEEGSRLVVSSGHLIGPDGKVVGEDNGMPDFSDKYLQLLSEGGLPQRDHVRINSRGTADAKGHGKFDEQLVPRGARFVFELCLQGTEADAEHWQQLLDQFLQPFFRIGGGTRKGFGQLRVVEIQKGSLDLQQADQREAYLNLPAMLDAPLPPAFQTITEPASAPKSDKWEIYTLRLTARDFFQFGRGVGGETTTGERNQDGKKGWVNQLPKRETTISWENGKPRLLTEEKAPYLLPATSIKGALSHRTAFYFNKLQKRFIEHQETPDVPTPDYDTIVAELLDDDGTMPRTQEEIKATIERLQDQKNRIEELDFSKSAAYSSYTQELEATQTDDRRPHVGENNEAVRALFGFAVERYEEENGKKQSAQRGNVLINDVFLFDDEVKTKTFSHVMIDRFTGGAKAGALFNEDVASSDKEIELKIHVHEDAFTGEDGEKIRQAFDEALLDLRNGRLPLGGGVAKGHGRFSGTLIPPKSQNA
ncbi:RAMP superfamily CRISPR-associated protein [Neolewinella agarilytica]|uniref:CRISPR/Cas system CSM-associated protein Csm3, group 7 of RAMP superfamily n=1 Tax=Neolewinella agarilytica TaxID=478744 RepID=A0A1H8Z7Z5_9BACT|nr:RAMP superfamily CRISPR-associated protein [Neolewinella agarilytica]SEP60579.1 CRISPR/Cas system CSM-associated protein Csm3, group 7 of RAMP superfamily [Neolewinella agarilytica]